MGWLNWFCGNFVSILFLFPLIDPDLSLANHLVLEDDSVHFLWPIPLTPAEQNFVHQFGTRPLEEKFNEARLPFVFDEHRRSCV